MIYASCHSVWPCTSPHNTFTRHAAQAAQKHTTDLRTCLLTRCVLPLSHYLLTIQNCSFPLRDCLLLLFKLQMVIQGALGKVTS